MNVAIVLAGGIGSRVGADVPKQFIKVRGREVLSYTLERFDRHPEVDAIEVVCRAGYEKELASIVERDGIKKVRWVAEGGKTFQDSVISGLKHLEGEVSDNDVVLIHYGASPFTSFAVISDAIRVCREKGNASPASQMPYLMARRTDAEKTTEWLDRDFVMRLNTPQALLFGYARDLYRRAEEGGWLDRVDPHTVSLMLAMGEPVYFSLDEGDNIKITTPQDLDLFRGWVLAREERGAHE